MKGRQRRVNVIVQICRQRRVHNTITPSVCCPVTRCCWLTFRFSCRSSQRLRDYKTHKVIDQLTIRIRSNSTHYCLVLGTALVMIGQTAAVRDGNRALATAPQLNQHCWSSNWLETNFTLHSFTYLLIITSLSTGCWCCHCVAMAITGYQPIRLQPASDDANHILTLRLVSVPCLSVCLSLSLFLSLSLCARAYTHTHTPRSVRKSLASSLDLVRTCLGSFKLRCKSQNYKDKKLSYRKQTVRLLHYWNQGLTLKPYNADRPISIKPRD